MEQIFFKKATIPIVLLRRGKWAPSNGVRKVYFIGKLQIKELLHSNEGLEFGKAIFMVLVLTYFALKTRSREIFRNDSGKRSFVKT